MKRIFGPALVLVSVGIALLIFCLFVFHASKHAEHKAAPAKTAQLPQNTTPYVPPPPPQYVIGLAHNMAAGSILSSSDVDTIAVPSGKYPKNSIPYSIKNSNYFIGSVLKQTALAGTPLEVNQVINPGSAGFLSAALSPGYQALTLQVSPQDDQSGLVYPGDRLDIILSQKVDGPSVGQSYVSETLLHNVRVLAIGDKITPVVGQSGYSMPAKMFTLELTPLMAKTLLLASTAGQISYTVLSSKNEDVKEISEGVEKPVFLNQISPYGDTNAHKITIFTPAGGQQDTAP